MKKLLSNEESQAGWFSLIPMLFILILVIVLIIPVISSVLSDPAISEQLGEPEISILNLMPIMIGISVILVFIYSFFKMFNSDEEERVILHDDESENITRTADERKKEKTKKKKEVEKIVLPKKYRKGVQSYRTVRADMILDNHKKKKEKTKK